MSYKNGHYICLYGLIDMIGVWGGIYFVEAAGVRHDDKHDSIALSIIISSGDYTVTFSNSLDSDQDRQNVGPDLGPNR